MVSAFKQYLFNMHLIRHVLMPKKEQETWNIKMIVVKVSSV